MPKVKQIYFETQDWNEPVFLSKECLTSNKSSIVKLSSFVNTSATFDEAITKLFNKTNVTEMDRRHFNKAIEDIEKKYSIANRNELKFDNIGVLVWKGEMSKPTVWGRLT